MLVGLLPSATLLNTMANSLKFFLFGPFQVFRNNRLITHDEWLSQQTRTMCKFLLASRGKVVSSEQIIDIFWPDESPDAARRRLHVRISQLRKALGSGKSLLQTVDGGYIFNLDETCWLDVDEFLALLAEAKLYQEDDRQPLAIRAYEQARELYRGDFLSEDLYADWAVSPREFLSERFLTLLIELSECYAQQGRFRLAIALCQEALAHDPVRETIYVRLMLYHFYAGERVQALRTIERCRKVLEDELAVKPLPSTLELASQIRDGKLWAGNDAPRYPPPIYEGRLFEVPYSLSEIPFVGREREYAWLIEQWRDDGTRVIMIEGEAGIGKSRLVETFAGYIFSQKARVLHARIPSTEHSPLLPIVTALRPLLEQNLNLPTTTLAALSTLFPGVSVLAGSLPRLPGLPPEAERQRLFQAVDVLVKACAHSRMLLVLDDAHHLGMAACELLVRLSGSLKVLLTFRSEEASTDHPIRSVFRNVRGANSVVIRQLEPLDSDCIKALIHRLAANDLPEIAQEVVDLSGGNPLYLVALLQHMFEIGQLYVDAIGGWGITGDQAVTIPPTVREIIEMRLRRLSRSQSRIFDQASVFGGEFDFALLQEASRQPENKLLAILDELMDLALIFEPRDRDRGEFSIAHDCYTEIVYETIPQARRKKMHLRAAEAIEKLYAGELQNYFGLLADHFARALVVERERHYACLAGEQAAAQFASREAIQYLSRALELTPNDDFTQRSRLYLARERVYDLLGDRHKQKNDLDALELLANKLETCKRAEISLRKAAYAWIIGDDTLSGPALEEAISLAYNSQATEIEAAAYLLRGRATTDQNTAREDLEKARILAQQNGLRGMEGDILRCIGNAFFWQNNFEESGTYFDQALKIHREVGDLHGELSALNNLGYLMQLLGDPNRSIAFYEQGLAIAQGTGDRLAEGVLLTNLGDLTIQSGNYARAQNWLEQAKVIREEIANEEGVGVALKRLGDVFRLQGKYMHARAMYERAFEISKRIDHREQQGGTLDSLALVHTELGDYSAAQNYFERAISVIKDEKSPDRIRALANRSLLYHLLADHKTALEFGMQALSLSKDLPQIHAIALTNVGHALAGLLNYEQARDHFEQALKIRRSLKQPHLATEPLAGLAELALEQNNLAKAQAWIEEILQIPNIQTLAGPDQLFSVYLTCYKVLHRSRDPRRHEIIEIAFSRLQERGAAIDNARLRQSYLEMVKANQAIVKLYSELNRSYAVQRA